MSENELNKVKNKIESSNAFSEMSVPNIAMNLAIFENIGDANLINTEIDLYLNISDQEIKTQANLIFNENNCSTLFYLSKN